MTDTDPDTAAFNARITAMCAFVQARCDEDQAAASAATKGPWLLDEGDEEPDHSLTLKGGPDQIPDVPGRETVVYSPHIWDETWPDFTHIARHDPARVLREVAAKRSRVAALLAYARKADEIHARPDRYGDGNRGEILGMLMAYMHAVCVDAEIWAGHPGYDPNWRVGP